MDGVDITTSLPNLPVAENPVRLPSSADRSGRRISDLTWTIRHIHWLAPSRFQQRLQKIVQFVQPYWLA
jgi:hypothetical protein